VVVDDQDGELVDLYSPTMQYQQVAFVREDLPPGPHQVVVLPSGQRNTRAKGSAVALDAFDTR